MAHTLISLLGGSNQIDPQKRYRKARYDFGAGPTAPTEFFGLALAHHIQPDRLVILGTSGSMWDVLLESLGLADSHSEELIALIDSAARDSTTQAQLQQLAPVVSERLGLAVALRLIPYGRNAAEQTEILARLADGLARGDGVSLDVTHGLRHLPILVQMSALYLRATRRVQIRAVYYGALEMTRAEVTPVMNLDGLLQLADWVGALHTFDKDGDYGVFAPLLQEQLPEPAQRLQEAAFYERTLRAGQARGKLREVQTALTQRPLSGIAGLFEPTLRERIDWSQEERLYQRQQALARDYLARDDFLRCSIYGFEAFITRLCQREGIANPESPGNRQAVKERYETQRPGPADFEQYEQLRGLRNKLAHGDQAIHGDIQRALTSADSLRATLQQLLGALLPQEK